ncbi:unnamed protein product [Clonostachys rosea f. rosea IK726]|uniref:Uncharacterized protein n=1 Tax=Clonostachys rosea f. rosea IK726 TaxID=1349383 RepID=A0ACA9UN84_BIOOC|nr:unnamed protein product [Clonostachys rosea f. rosea IK726]
MSEYTSTREGFQRAMEWSLSGDPNEAKAYAEALSTPNFYQVMNGKRLAFDTYVEDIAQWRAKASEYKPVVREFLRDGDLLSARMTGTIKVDDVPTHFECFMFAKVDRESGKMEYLNERSV